ncbi:MAG: hypothetical protein RBS99_03985 [Rhodospirillales bacterium]|jgi:hypothetical protein|nr:hypothetical protein [Rhodospirillales bacterium]
MSLHTYPLTAVIGDYSRSAGGLAVSVIPLVVAPSTPLVTYLFSGMIAVFLVYALRTAIRHFTRIELSDEGIGATLPTARRIDWTDLEILRLRYYSSKRDRSRGWFQMVLAGAGRRIVIDSPITDFHSIVARAAAAANRNGMQLDDATSANVAALTSASAAEGH